MRADGRTDMISQDMITLIVVSVCKYATNNKKTFAFVNCKTLVRDNPQFFISIMLPVSKKITFSARKSKWKVKKRRAKAGIEPMSLER